MRDCELRMIAALPLLERRAFLDLIEKRRGQPARKQIEQQLIDQWIAKRKTPHPYQEVAA